MATEQSKLSSPQECSVIADGWVATLQLTPEVFRSAYLRLLQRTNEALYTVVQSRLRPMSPAQEQALAAEAVQLLSARERVAGQIAALGTTAALPAGTSEVVKSLLAAWQKIVELRGIELPSAKRLLAAMETQLPEPPAMRFPKTRDELIDLMKQFFAIHQREATTIHIPAAMEMSFAEWNWVHPDELRRGFPTCFGMLIVWDADEFKLA